LERRCWFSTILLRLFSFFIIPPFSFSHHSYIDCSPNYIGSVRFSYNPYFSACFFSRNSVSLSQQISRNSVLTFFQRSEWGPSGLFVASPTLKQLQETLYIFLIYKNRDFSKNNIPTFSLFGYLNIDIPYSGFLASQRWRTRMAL